MIRAVMSPVTFRRYAVVVAIFNLAVIVWGAFVRATGSGAGCGDHWPTCNGEMIHRPRSIETLIELTHRATTGVLLLLVVGMVVSAFRGFPKGHPVRVGAAASGFFLVVESLLGAGLVLFRLVTTNASIARAWYLALHLINTFMLVAAITLTAWWAWGGRRVAVAGRTGLATAVGAGLAGTVLLAVTGGVAALGDTLFPAHSLAEGLAQDLDPSSHVLLHLRLWHPVVALAVGVYLVAMSWTVWARTRSPGTRALAGGLTAAFVTQLGLGVLNVFLLAPVWLQLVHLFVADLVWILLVMFSAAALAAPARDDVADTAALGAPATA